MNKPQGLNLTREQITSLDNELLTLLSKRRELSLEVARSKEVDVRPIRDTQREKELLEPLLQQRREKGLDAHFVISLYESIIEDSVLNQQAYLQQVLGFEKGEMYQKKKIDDIPQMIQKMGFIALNAVVKVIFKRNVFQVIVSLKKRKQNELNGIMGFLPKENGQLQLTGDVKLNVVNLFKRGIQTKIYWKKQYKKHPNFRGYTRQDEYSPFRTFISKGRGSIKKKGCTIDVKYLKTIWEFQNGICPYTGIKMILPKNTLEYNSTKSLKKASLDRIDSSKGYVEGNLEFVCCGINFAKNNFTKKDMTSFLDEIMSSMNALSVTQVQPT